MTMSPESGGRSRADADPPQYTRYRARRRLLRGDEPAGLAGLRDERGVRRRILPRRREGGWRKLTPKRALLWLVALVVAWLLLSLVLFLISAQFEEQHEPSSTTIALDGGGKFPLISTIDDPRARLRRVACRDARSRAATSSASRRGRTRSC